MFMMSTGISVFGVDAGHDVVVSLFIDVHNSCCYFSVSS